MEKIRPFAEERGVEVRVAFDGMEEVLRREPLEGGEPRLDGAGNPIPKWVMAVQAALSVTGRFPRSNDGGKTICPNCPTPRRWTRRKFRSAC